MKRRLLPILLVSACGGNTHHDLQVMSYAPQGPVDKSQPVEIRFDKPVVDDAHVGKPADPASVKLVPAIAWKGFWQDRQTLVVEPTEPLAASTRYQVALTGELAKRTQNFAFSFVHKPLVVEGVWGVDADSLAPDGNVPVSFNQPVRATDAMTHCKLVGSKGDIALRAVTPAATESNIALRPAAKLEPGTQYTLTCSDLVGIGGNASLEKPYSLALHTRPPLAVTRVTPDGNDIAADEVTITVAFATPVTLEAARKAVMAKPAIANIDQGYLSGDGTEYKVTADLDTETDYTLIVANLSDTFGQKLGQAYEHHFRTGDARPRLSMERGIFALEASAKGYPVWSRNIGKYDVECGVIPKDRVVQVLTTDMNYDPWGGNDDGKDIDWKSIKVTPRTVTRTAAGRNKWRLSELDLGSTCANAPGMRGVFLAEVRSDEIHPDPQRSWLNPRRNRVLANVTDMGVLLKVGSASGLVWVTSLSTGQPVVGAKVAVFTPQGKQVYTDLTNGDGVVKIPGSALLKDQKPTGDDPDPEAAEDWENYRAQRLIATVEKGGDLAIVDGNWSNGIQIWNFGLPEDRHGGAIKIRGFIQSDRGLYRPGESVHFKGIAREIASGRPPRVPTAKPVAIQVTDSRGQVVLDTNSTLSGFGGFAFDMNLGADATLGDYYVAATVAGQVFREKFSVEEFRPASFELGLKSGQATPKPGERLTFDLDAKYLFGSPVTSAKVEWNLRKRTHALRFPGFDEYTFSSNPRAFWWWADRNDYGEMVGDGAGTTDAQGHLAIAARDAATEFTGPIDYILSASVTDSSDQTMGKSTVVTAHKTQMYLGMHANEMVQAVGMPFGVNLVAIKPDGTRTAAKAKLSFIKSQRSCAWEEMGARSYQKCESTDKTMIEREVGIAEAGSHTERIYPTEPGDYVVKAETKDAAGNPVIVASEIWVIGKGEAFWSGDEGDRMTLVASKPSYEPGDTARLVAQANLVNPTALITIERDGVLEARVKKLASASEGVELTIADGWAPNVFASVALVAGRHGAGDRNRPMFKMGVVELKVSSAHKQLDVAVSLDKDHVRPGDKVAGKIHVSRGGKPVRAEVSLSAADEGVLQLIAYQTPNPMKTFYAAYGLGVDAGTNWNRVARIADPETGDPDVGGDAASRGDGQRIRSKFVSSAFWAPMLVTDQNGDIAFSFVAPDNLTAFRLMAVAADNADQFGAGELRLTVAKPLMAAPAVPRFLRSGDTASVGVVIHNHTDAKGAATVTAKANGAVLDAASRTVDVPANGSVRVRFAAKAGTNAAVSFDFGVAMGKERDAVRVTIPIDKQRVVETRTLADKALGQGDTWQGVLATGSDVIRGDSMLTVTIDRSGVGELAPSLRSLVEYPYGCLEQTLSRFVPLVAAKDLAQTLDDASLRGTKMDQFIKAGVAKVIRHQQGDGLFSLWPQSQTYPHLAAYALWGLTVAQKAGVEVPADTFDRGIRGLVQWTNGAGNLKPDGSAGAAAMGAYVMAWRGKPDTGLDARLYAMRTGLPKWGQAFLLRAMAASKADPSQISELEKLLVSGVVVSDGRAMIHDGADDRYWSTDIRATAMTLAALLEVDPQSPLIDPLAAGLKAERKPSGGWMSTQENLWSLVALAQYAKRATAGDVTAKVTVGGKVVSSRHIAGAEISTVRVPLGEVTGDAIAVAVDKPAHVSVRLAESRSDAGTAASNGFTVARTYADAKGNPIAKAKAGDIVTVKLAITAAAGQRWIAVVDPLPAGFEVVNPKLAAGAAADQKPADPYASRWYRPTWVHQEIRDDRVMWFSDELSAGQFELSYTARATIDGTFTAMPATVEAMYHPDVRGRSAKTTFTVVP